MTFAYFQTILAFLLFVAADTERDVAKRVFLIVSLFCFAAASVLADCLIVMVKIAAF